MEEEEIIFHDNPNQARVRIRPDEYYYIRYMIAVPYKNEWLAGEEPKIFPLDNYVEPQLSFRNIDVYRPGVVYNTPFDKRKIKKHYTYWYGRVLGKKIIPVLLETMVYLGCDESYTEYIDGYGLPQQVLKRVNNKDPIERNRIVPTTNFIKVGNYFFKEWLIHCYNPNIENIFISYYDWLDKFLYFDQYDNGLTGAFSRENIDITFCTTPNIVPLQENLQLGRHRRNIYDRPIDNGAMPIVKQYLETLIPILSNTFVISFPIIPHIRSRSRSRSPPRTRSRSRSRSPPRRRSPSPKPLTSPK